MFTNSILCQAPVKLIHHKELTAQLQNFIRINRCKLIVHQFTAGK
jgi:hypothetical protein